MATLILHSGEELHELVDLAGRIRLDDIETVIKVEGKTTEVIYSPTTLEEPLVIEVEDVIK